MVVAVDFDGVLNACDYPAVGVLVAGAKKGMQYLKDKGYTLIVWTCREGQDQTDAVNFLLRHGIPFDGINCHAQENLEKYSNDSRKVYADIYIDDHNLGGFPGWDNVIKMFEDEEERTIAEGYSLCY